MKIGATCFALALASVSLTSPLAAQNSGETYDFAIGDAQFTLDMPDGFCVPQGEQARIAREQDAGDSQNETPVNIHACGAYGRNYILIKTPRGVPALPVSKAQFLDILAVELQKQENMERGAEIGKKDLKGTLGNDLEVDADGISYSGRDEECGYMSGAIPISNGQGQSALLLIGSCGTLVGDRHMVIHSYALEGMGLTLDQLMARSKEVAMAVSPK